MPIAQDSLTITNISDNRGEYAGGEIPKYEKYEVTFEVNTAATNLQFPYDPTPPPGIEPANNLLHNGISVDAIFADPTGGIYQQPAFYYEIFDDNDNGTKTGLDGIEDFWYYPTGHFVWKVRFSPHMSGNWQVYLKAEDATGSATTQLTPINFRVIQSANHGFLKVSPSDPRYFEFDDGTPFRGLGFHSAGHPILTEQSQFETFSENGITLLRTWISDLYGAAWPEWLGGRNKYDGYLPRPGILPFQDPNTNDVSMTLHVDYEIEGNTGWFDGCRIQILNKPEAVKRNTDYRVQIKYWGENINGPRILDYSEYGLVAKIGGWHSDCYEPGTSTVITNYGGNTNNWQTIEGIWNSGDNDFLPKIHIGLENVTEGEIYINSISVREDLGSGQVGPEILMQPSMEYQLYYPQLRAYEIDRAIELVEQDNLYLKVVIQDKGDKIYYKIDDDGSFVLSGEPDNEDGFYGNGYADDKIRWLQRAYWRYLQARWGYSPNVHSWEFTNEGNPDLDEHWSSTDLLGRYMKCEVFGVPVLDTNNDNQHFEGDHCDFDHPNAHMVTTSLWHSYPAVNFWINPDYPNVDYADLHAYISTGWMQDPEHETDAAQFHLDYSSWARTETDDAAFQNSVTTKPIIRGETGIDFVDLQIEQPDLALDENGVWLHNLLWSTLDPGAMSEIYWWRTNLENRTGPDGQAGLHEVFRYLNNFITSIPINNGFYEDVQATLDDPEIRVTGQKDTENDRAHLWVQNTNHTWRNVVDSVSGITGLTGKVTIEGFTPKEELNVEWHEFTSQGTPLISCSSVTPNDEGALDLALPVDTSISDVGIKIGDYSDFEITHNLQIVMHENSLSAVPGDTLTYTFNFTNTGYIEATGVTLTVTLPANTSINPIVSSVNWDCGSDNGAGDVCTLYLGTLDGGASGSVDFAIGVENSVPAGVNNILNTVEIGEDDTSCKDQNLDDNTDSVMTLVNAAPDLQLEIEPSAENAVMGETFAYKLTYSNVGNQDATGVIITDTFPAKATFKRDTSTAGWQCDLGEWTGSPCTFAIETVPAGSKGVIHLSIDMPDPTLVNLTEIVNIAEVRDDGTNGFDLYPVDNVAYVVTPVRYIIYLILVSANG